LIRLRSKRPTSKRLTCSALSSAPPSITPPEKGGKSIEEPSDRLGTPPPFGVGRCAWPGPAL